MPVGKGSIERIQKAQNDTAVEKVKAPAVKRNQPKKAPAPKAAPRKAAVRKEKIQEPKKAPSSKGYYSGNDLPPYLL